MNKRVADISRPFLSFVLSIVVVVLVVGGVFAQDALPEKVTVVKEGLFPEGVAYDRVHDRFYVSSVTEGTVYAVADDGTLTPFVQDERITASVGLEVDEALNRLLVVATDMRSEAFLGIYDLTTGENVNWIDLRPLTPTDEQRFANDVAVDGSGNAYVTDSLAGVIYRVDPIGNGEVFLEDQSFSTNMTLNGIVYHETGNVLIAVRKPGLIKIPLDNPAEFTEIPVSEPFPGADGLILLDERTLVVVNNKPPRVYRLESDDLFETTQITGVFEPGSVFPTTAAARDGNAYVLYAQLNREETPASEFPIVRADFAAATPEP